MWKWWWLAALPIGAAVGFALAAYTAPNFEDKDASQPAAASDPSLPADAPLSLLPDPNVEPLATDLTTQREQVGGRGFEAYVSVPEDWTRVDIGAAEARWLVADNPEYSYFMRAENVYSQRTPIDEILQQRLTSLQESSDEFELLDQTTDTIKFSWVADQHKRISYVRWYDVRGDGVAFVELSVVGRVTDDEGLQSLLDQAAVSATR